MKLGSKLAFSFGISMVLFIMLGVMVCTESGTATKSISVVLAAVLGAVAYRRLAARIVTPLRRLDEMAKSVAREYLPEIGIVDQKDEIESLESSFTQMERRLKDTLSSLELATTRLHEKQEKLVEAEKLASLGRIAAGVAHEINNPLAIINEKAGLMQDILRMCGDFQHKEKFLNLLDGIMVSVNRCRTITHHLLGFARRIDVIVEPMDLNEAVTEAKEFLANDIVLKNIRAELHLGEDLPKIKSDKGLLEQVFLNVIKNAIDAVEEGGIVMVSTGVKDKNTAFVSIRDNGPGIPSDKLRHIFEPFFTTKERGKGTGLGLFVSYGIMKKLGASILVESEIGKGTTFTLEIPLHPRFWEGTV